MRHASAWTTFWRTVRGRAYPRVIGAQRERSWVFFEIFLPLLSVSAYVYIYRAVQAPPEFIGFVVLGGAMSAYWMNVLWSMATQLYWEKETGNLELYIVAPTSRMAILLGMSLGGIVATTLRAIAVVAMEPWSSTCTSPCRTSPSFSRSSW
jgi:ABC-2 type transport system permease protein